MAKKDDVVRVSGEVSIDGMTKANAGFATGQRKVKANGKQGWVQTVLWFNERHPLSSYDSSKDVKDIAEELRVDFKDTFLGEYEDLPEFGTNARTGRRDMKLCDKDGNPKWSSWDETKNSISYLGDMAQVVKASLVDDLLVSDKSVLGKSAILNKAKGVESPIDAIQRGLKLVTEKYADLNLTDLASVSAQVEALYIAIASHQDDVEKALEA